MTDSNTHSSSHCVSYVISSTFLFQFLFEFGATHIVEYRILAYAPRQFLIWCDVDFQPQPARHGMSIFTHFIPLRLHLRWGCSHICCSCACACVCVCVARANQPFTSTMVTGMTLQINNLIGRMAKNKRACTHLRITACRPLQNKSMKLPHSRNNSLILRICLNGDPCV